VSGISLSSIRAIVQQPMQGLTLTRWFSNWSRTTSLAVRRQLQVGIAAGESVDQLARRIGGTRRLGFRDGILQTSRRQAQAIARTGANHVSTQARELVYAENADLVKAVQIVATLDGRTTLICQGLDGEVFPVLEGPRPPFHVQCRTTTTPVLRSLQELGLDPQDFPASTRASMNGQVPEAQNFAQWLRRQPVSVQNEALGPTRARLFRGNRVTIDRFTDPQHMPLTLEQLRVTEGL
jgi:SPP1 gp7 family putative phage head morphogenesis protein